MKTIVFYLSGLMIWSLLLHVLRILFDTQPDNIIIYPLTIFVTVTGCIIILHLIPAVGNYIGEKWNKPL